jgi:hypothetical protein
MKTEKGDEFIIDIEMEGRKFFSTKAFHLKSGFKIVIRQRDGEKMMESVVISGFSGQEDLTVTVDAGGQSRLRRRTQR